MGSSKLSKVSLHLAEFLLCVCVYSDLGQLVLHMLIKQPVFVGVFLIQCIQMIYVCVCLCLCVFYSIHKQFCRQYACTVVGFPSWTLWGLCGICTCTLTNEFCWVRALGISIGWEDCVCKCIPNVCQNGGVSAYVCRWLSQCSSLTETASVHRSLYSCCVCVCVCRWLSQLSSLTETAGLHKSLYLCCVSVCAGDSASGLLWLKSPVYTEAWIGIVCVSLSVQMTQPVVFSDSNRQCTQKPVLVLCLCVCRWRSWLVSRTQCMQRPMWTWTSTTLCWMCWLSTRRQTPCRTWPWSWPP